MNENVIIKLIEGIGNPYLLFITLIMSILCVIFKNNIAIYVNKNFLTFFYRRDIRSIKDLKHHDVFNTLGRAVYEVKIQKYYTHKEYDAVKTRMCYDFTKNKSTSCGKLMKQFVERKDVDYMRVDSLKNLIINLQNDMHKDYIKTTTDLWLSKGIDEKDVRHVVHLFEKFRYDVVSSFSHRIEAIFGSSFHINNYERVLAVFDMWAMGIDLLPKDMQTTFENLNGKFKDIKY